MLISAGIGQKFILLLNNLSYELVNSVDDRLTTKLFSAACFRFLNRLFLVVLKLNHSLLTYHLYQNLKIAV